MKVGTQKETILIDIRKFTLEKDKLFYRRRWTYIVPKTLILTSEHTSIPCRWHYKVLQFTGTFWKKQ